MDKVFPEQPVNQWVSSVPNTSRIPLASRPGVMVRVLGMVYRCVATHPIRKAGFSRKTAQTGAVTRIQRFGSALNTFTGDRNDIREVYARSNPMLSLSHQPESFRRTVLEARSPGVPVVGYDHGGVGEILTNLFPEGRVSVGDIDELTARVEQFPANTPSVPAGHLHTLQRMLDSTLALYADVAT